MTDASEQGGQRRPNILFVMSDEHAPMLSGTYGHPRVRTPNLNALAADGVVFDNAYCNSPICVPSRMSLLTGRYASNVDAFDLASELRTDAVTYAHLLRAAGYDVVLAGKQHFAGPDKLHGFRAQLSRDMHEHEHPLLPWPDDEPREAPWRHPLEAGCGRSEVIEVDDETEAASIAYLRQNAGSHQPWMLCVSFIAPHWPYVVPEPYWSEYYPNVDVPHVTEEEVSRMHPALQRLRRRLGVHEYTEKQTRAARAAYYGMVTQLDERIGRLLAMLADTGADQETVVIYTSDHGGMMGEHGLWRKMNFYEAAVRVPLIVKDPRLEDRGRRISEVVSLVDLTVGIADVAGTGFPGVVDGRSLFELVRGNNLETPWHDTAFSEYLAHGVARPLAMLRQGRYKLTAYVGEGYELYDVEADPDERLNLWGDPQHAQVAAQLQGRLAETWDGEEVERRVLASQRDRLLIRAAVGAPRGVEAG